MGGGRFVGRNLWEPLVFMFLGLSDMFLSMAGDG